ncbi:hypothetical protein F5Y10DRAFT_249525 [Nemania abortiva]|nr:hypothetical protein F5Y10DRAFT_249525 [Nemania abortiva]
MMVLQDGKVAKLRAACDGCNESKVRCSQTKPQCRRCERQGVPCVYGLSRRSHKTAPRVGASATATERFMASNVDPSLILESSDATPSGPNPISVAEANAIALSTANTGDGASGLVEAATIEDRPAVTMDDSERARAIVTSSMDSMLGFDAYLRLLADSGLPSGFDPIFNLGSDTVMGTGDFASQCLPPPSSSSAYAGPSGSHDGSFSPRAPSEPPKRSRSIFCNCKTLAKKELLSMPFHAEEDTGSLDVTFSRLKQAIRTSEECISCTCTTRDEMSIIITSTLIGHIIEGFEICMEKANPLMGMNGMSTADSSEDSSPGSVVPTLSWGVLQIEPDEEAELRQHMWLIQLRKLQRVIKKLGVAVGLLRNAQDSGNSAHIVTCQCMHVWLTQKAEVLQERHLNTDGVSVAKEVLARRRSVCPE